MSQGDRNVKRCLRYVGYRLTVVGVALLVSAFLGPLGQAAAVAPEPPSAQPSEASRPGYVALVRSPAIPSLEAFLQIGSAASPQISQDGTTILFTSSVSGVAQVYEILRSGWPYH